MRKLHGAGSMKHRRYDLSLEKGLRETTMIKYISMFFALIIGLMSQAAFAAQQLASNVESEGMVGLSDDELGQATAQALFNLSYLAPGQAGNPTSAASNIGFYTLGMEAQVSINANIKNLQVGCGGVNGAGGCDIDIQNFSLGCIANASGTCISLPPTGNQVAGAVSDTLPNQQQMKDLVLTNPFYQFAVRNPNSASTREIVGMRIGAANVNGPMSFGQINTFSGYLTANANLSLTGGNNIAVTCRYPASCVAPGANTTGMVNNGASSWGSPVTSCGFFCSRGGQGTPSGGWLELGDDMILDIGIAKIRFQEALVNIGNVTRTGIGVALSGNRQTQAGLSGVNLAGVVNSLVYGNTDGSTNVGATPLELQDSDAGALVSIFGSALLPALRGGIADQIKRQLAQGLRVYNPNAATNQTTVNGKSDAEIHNDLNAYVLPYNASNLHQVNVNSAGFGLSLQSQDLQYPGYDQAVTRGWAMYLPDAFTLNINRPLATNYNAGGAVTSEGIIRNILSSSNARDGNIVGLEPPYRNCWGTLTFC